MQLFESRNVLDRIETVWNMFFSSEWKLRILPQMIVGAIGIPIGLILLVPIIRGLIHIVQSELGDSPMILGEVAMIGLYLLLMITILTVVGGIISTYTLITAREQKLEKTWEEYMILAWRHLWGWAWYGAWYILFFVTIILTGFILFMISESVFYFALLPLILVYIWSIVPIYAGAPGYILENAWSPNRFAQVFFLTTMRWWRTLGNIILGSIVISSVLSLIQQFFYWLAGINYYASQLESVDTSEGFDFAELFADMDELAWMRLIIAGISIVILGVGQKVFVTLFQYVVWKDIITDAPETATGEKKEE